MVAKVALPEDNHISRFVPYSKQFRDVETDAFLGLGPGACALRENDDGGLSVNWIEHFGPYGVSAKKKSAIAYRESLLSKKLPAKGVFAYTKVEKFRASCANKGKKVRIVHAPVGGNEGHAEVRQFTDDDFDLLEALAADVFDDFDIVSQMGL